MCIHELHLRHRLAVLKGSHMRVVPNHIAKLIPMYSDSH